MDVPEFTADAVFGIACAYSAGCFRQAADISQVTLR
jgi:hypothetical protein